MRSRRTGFRAGTVGAMGMGEQVQVVARRRRRSTVALVVVAVLALIAAPRMATAAPSIPASVEPARSADTGPTGRLSHDGRWLTDTDGRVVQVHGVNIVAKFAIVSAILEVDDRPQVWLLVKTSGKLLKLHEGDAVEVGQFKGKITKISRLDVEIESEGKRQLIALGENLRQAATLPKDEI